jgi:glycosyltransferase involved in cell wall biosynthesis
LAVAGLGIPVIGSEHIVAEHYRNRPADYILYALSSFFLKRITVLSESVKTAFPWILRRKMAVISNPVEAVTIGDPSKRRDIILAIGRLDPQKDHSTLISAFARIAPSHPNWTLKIIGDGPLQAELQAQINSLQLASRITLLPATRDIGPAYEEASIFVVPSLYESFGMVTVEAMMAGLPCIGFATCPGTNEIITDQVTGLLVQPVPDRITALSDAMVRLINTPLQREQLGLAAQQDARKYAAAPILQHWQTLLQETARS